MGRQLGFLRPLGETAGAAAGWFAHVAFWRRRYLDGCGESGALSRLKERGRLQLKHPNVRD
jgi:hypothetical protein